MTTPLTPGVSEEQDQILLVNWVRRHHPGLAESLHHSPNGGYRNKATGARMRLMGTSPGFPDLVFFYPTDRHQGLAIELKAEGGRASPNQLAWLDRLKAAGFLTAVCFGLDEARRTIEEYIA